MRILVAYSLDSDFENFESETERAITEAIQPVSVEFVSVPRFYDLLRVSTDGYDRVFFVFSPKGEWKEVLGPILVELLKKGDVIMDWYENLDTKEAISLLLQRL